MSSINQKRRSHEPAKSEVPMPVRWVEGEELTSEGWHEDWDEGPASHISMISELPEEETNEKAERERAYEDEKAWLEDEGGGAGSEGGDAVVGEGEALEGEDDD